MCGVLFAVLIFLVAATNLDGPHSHRLANQAAAVNKLRTVVTLQDQYAVAHAYNGFACELPLLKPFEQRNEPDYFLITGMHSGYSFSLVNCGSDANRERVHYIVYIGPAPKGVHQPGEESNKFVSIAFNSSQFGLLRMSNGDFEFLGQD
jgi:hypothetical protein